MRPNVTRQLATSDCARSRAPWKFGSRPKFCFPSYRVASRSCSKRQPGGPESGFRCRAPVFLGGRRHRGRRSAGSVERPETYREGGSRVGARFRLGTRRHLRRSGAVSAIDGGRCRTLQDAETARRGGRRGKCSSAISVCTPARMSAKRRPSSRLMPGSRLPTTGSPNCPSKKASTAGRGWTSFLLISAMERCGPDMQTVQER